MEALNTDDLLAKMRFASAVRPGDLVIMRAGTITNAARVIELYRGQIGYLLGELHRIGWTPYPTEPMREA